MNEQQDAAEYYEKILNLTSPDASQVKTKSISKKICKLNEKLLSTSVCIFVLSDVPRMVDGQDHMFCMWHRDGH